MKAVSFIKCVVAYKEKDSLSPSTTLYK